MINFQTILTADGDIPPKSFWEICSYEYLICTDGAADVLRHLGQQPNIIIGDLDTLINRYGSLESIKKTFPKAKIIQKIQQDSTDFEKAINYATTNLSGSLLCLGLFGKAIDHTLHNLSAFCKIVPPIFATNKLPSISWAHQFGDTRQWGFVLPQQCSIYTEPNQLISFHPMPEATLSSDGLKWELNDSLLHLSGGASVRNRTQKKRITLRTKGICLAILSQAQCPVVTTVQ